MEIPFAEIITSSHIPFVERLEARVVLQASLVNQELHALKEGGRDGWRLFPQQDVDGFGRAHTQLAHATRGILATFGVLAVHESI